MTVEKCHMIHIIFIIFLFLFCPFIYASPCEEGAFSDSREDPLARTVRIFQSYLTPEQISEIPLSHKKAKKGDPDFLLQNIQILKEILHLHDKNPSEKRQARRQKNTHQKPPALISHSLREEALIDIIKVHSLELLSVHPEQLQSTVILLNKYLTQTDFQALLIAGNRNRDSFSEALLKMDSQKLKAMEATLKPYFDTGALGLLIAVNFVDIVHLDQLNFTNIMHIIKPYLDQKDIAKQVNTMFLHNRKSMGWLMRKLRPAYEELSRLNTTLSQKQMKGLLTQFPIFKLDPRANKYEHFLQHPEEYLDLGDSLIGAGSAIPKAQLH